MVTRERGHAQLSLKGKEMRKSHILGLMCWTKSTAEQFICIFRERLLDCLFLLVFFQRERRIPP